MDSVQSLPEGFSHMSENVCGSLIMPLSPLILSQMLFLKSWAWGKEELSLVLNRKSFPVTNYPDENFKGWG